MKGKQLKYELAITLVLFFIVTAIAVTLTYQRDEQLKRNAALVEQNMKLTADVRSAKADGFRAGLITCGNEDVKWLNEKADYYESIAGTNALSKLMHDWAQTWTYSDEVLNKMTEAYMEEGTN